MEMLDEDVRRKPGSTSPRHGDPDAILMSAYVAEPNYSMYCV